MDAIERIEKATAVAVEKVKGIKADQRTNATPCSEFDVNALLQHMLTGFKMMTDAAASGTGAVEPQEVAEDAGAQFEAAREGLVAAWKQPGVLEKTLNMPFGAMPGAMIAGICFMENVTHAWDVAKATGQNTNLPDDLVQECIDLVKPMEGMLRSPGVCGPAVAVSDSAPLSDQLAGFMGRTV